MKRQTFNRWHRVLLHFTSNKHLGEYKPITIKAKLFNCVIYEQPTCLIVKSHWQELWAQNMSKSTKLCFEWIGLDSITFFLGV